MKLTKEFKEYIDNVTLDFISATNYITSYKELEYERQDSIKDSLIVFAKVFKNEDVSDEEYNLIKDYIKEYDIHNEYQECVASIIYHISSSILEKVNKIRLSRYEYYWSNKSSYKDNYYKIYQPYRDYFVYLGEYVSSISHALCYQHIISIIEPENRNNITPSFDFNNNCFIEPNFEKEDHLSFIKRLFKRR